MRKRRHSEVEEDETVINLTPMLDIIFIMLIFFIVTTSFVKESGINVNRPSAQTAERKERGNVFIAISATGEIWIDKKPVDIRALRAAVERIRAERPESAVVIQGDKAASIGLLVEVMDQVRKGGISNVSIAAEQAP